MKYFFYISISVFLAFLILMGSNFLASDFDKFSRELISKYGSSSEPLASDDLANYLEENNIDDPVSFFRKEMNLFSDYKRKTDESISSQDIRYLERNNAESSIGFTKKFRPFFPIVYSELRVFVYEDAEGETFIRAFTFHHGP